MDNPPWSDDSASGERARQLAMACWAAAILAVVGALWVAFRWEPIPMSVRGVVAGGMTLHVSPGYSGEDCDQDVRVSVAEETHDTVALAASQERFLLPDFSDGCGALDYVEVPLKAPLGDRRVFDAHSGQELIVLKD